MNRLFRTLQVQQIDVFFEHALRAEFGRTGNDCRFGDSHPARRYAMGIAIVVGRCHFGFEQVVEMLSIVPVLGIEVVVCLFAADGPAIGTVIGLRPPPIEDTKVGDAVEAGLLATSPAGLIRSAGVLSHTSTPCTKALATHMSYSSRKIIRPAKPGSWERR